MKTIGDALRHRRALLAAIVLGCVGVAGVLSVVRHKTYEASALLYVDERHNSSQGFDLALQAGELMAHHYIEMATSVSVLEAVCTSPEVAALPHDQPCTAGQLAGHVRAGTVKGTSQIAVTVSAPTPEAAVVVANVDARTLVEQDQQQVHKLLQPTRDYLDAELKRLDDAITAERAALAESPANSPPAQAHLARLNQLQAQYDSDYTRRQDLAVEEFRLAGNLTVIQAAQTPLKPVDPDPLRYVVSGLVVGLVLGLLVALLVEYFDDHLLEPEQLGRATGTGLVVKVPKPPRNAGLAGRPAPFALAHAHLMALQHPFHMLLVTGATARDPADAVAGELAGAAAEAGQKVVVIPSDATDVARRNPAELTVIAAPSPETSARVVRLAAAGGPVIVVATAGRTRFREAQRTAELLRQAGAQVVAAVLVARGGLNGAEGSHGRRHLA